MIWLKILEAGAILAAGLFLIAFLEHTFVSGPRRRQLERQARERREAAKKKSDAEASLKSEIL